MSIDPEMARKLADLKKQLEEISGKEIDASPEQLVRKRPSDRTALTA